MDQIHDGWFMEKGQMWPGQAMSLQVKEVLYHGKSKFQDILIFESETYGRVLVLDGVIQVTERDEFSYQEMITHLPMMSHPNPRKILVIGGGDGGVLREVVKHPSVESVVLCDIDGDVIELSKKYLPSTSVGYSDPRVTTFIGDGFQFMKEHTNEFDVIITDSSDPIGPGESLFQSSYYELMKGALAEGGIVCAQGECLWLHKELITNMLKFTRDHYAVVDYGYTTIPTYPSGQIGFILCSLNSETNFRKPLREFDAETMKALRYYNKDIHSAAFVLPQFAAHIRD